MPGIGLALSPTFGGAGVADALGQGVGIATHFSADFVNGAYVIDDESVTAGEAYSLTRASAGKAADSSGVWSDFSTDEARITDAGLLIEVASSNGIRTPDMTGASPNPDNWVPGEWAAPYAFNGISWTMPAKGTEDGLDYVDFLFSGTASGTGGVLFFFDQSNTIATVQGDTWTPSTFMKIVSGDIGGVSVIRHRAYERKSDGGDAASGPNDHYGADLKAALTSTLTRFTDDPTSFLAIGASDAAYMQPALEVLFTGASDSLRLRVCWPQTEKNKTLATSPYKGSRSADVVTLHLPGSETHDLVYTFDDDTTQTVSEVSGGDYVIDPATLDRPQVKSVVWRSV